MIELLLGMLSLLVLLIIWNMPGGRALIVTLTGTSAVLAAVVGLLVWQGLQAEEERARLREQTEAARHQTVEDARRRRLREWEAALQAESARYHLREQQR